MIFFIWIKSMSLFNIFLFKVKFQNKMSHNGLELLKSNIFSKKHVILNLKIDF
jgi:hypothetical protein